jgi:hypothetical protein
MASSEIKALETREAAIKFLNEIASEKQVTKKVNDLLDATVIKFDVNKHLKATLAPKDWLNNGIPLVVLFCLETCEPICAYFEGADN